MLPPLLLDPQAGESILDMAAAPGGKTTELAALSGGEMVYSTCSVLREENEGLLQSVMPPDAEIVPVDPARLAGIPLLPTAIGGTVCICPDDLYEGFFAAVLSKRPMGK